MKLSEVTCHNVQEYYRQQFKLYVDANKEWTQQYTLTSVEEFFVKSQLSWITRIELNLSQTKPTKQSARYCQFLEYFFTNLTHLQLAMRLSYMGEPCPKSKCHTELSRKYNKFRKLLRYIRNDEHLTKKDRIGYHEIKKSFIKVARSLAAHPEIQTLVAIDALEMVGYYGKHTGLDIDTNELVIRIRELHDGAGDIQETIRYLTKL